MSIDLTHIHTYSLKNLQMLPVLLICILTKTARVKENRATRLIRQKLNSSFQSEIPKDRHGYVFTSD